MIKIIVLTGYKQSGKSTVSNYLMMQNGYTILKFADKLKNMIRALDLNDEYIDGRFKEIELEKFCGKSTRYIMQTLGTEWGRKLIGKDFWIRQLKETLDCLIKTGVVNFVIDDLRFENEEKFINSLRFVPYNYDVNIIKISRNGCVETNHESETYIKHIVEDWTIFNNSTKEELFKSVDDIIGG